MESMQSSRDVIATEVREAQARAVHPLRPLLRAMALQLLRRKELFVVGILLSLYVLAALIVQLVGSGGGATARFLAGLGLQLGSLLSTLLVLVLAARQLPEEIELRTIYPILAKPVTRGTVLLGKLLPVWLLGAAAMTLFMLATLLAVPGLAGIDWRLLPQALGLQVLALGVVTALAGWLSLWLPPALAMLAGGALIFAGPLLGNLLASQLTGALGGWVAGLLPHVPMLVCWQRLAQGGAALGPATSLGLVIYGLLWLGLFAGLMRARFQRLSL